MFNERWKQYDEEGLTRVTLKAIADDSRPHSIMAGPAGQVIVEGNRWSTQATAVRALSSVLAQVKHQMCCGLFESDEDKEMKSANKDTRIRG